MPNLKEVRDRIESVRSTQQITSAMKLVSAAKLRRGQEAIQKIRPYANKLHQILGDLSQNTEDLEDEEYTHPRDPEKILLLIISSNRGLCGAFNSHIIKFTHKIISENYQKQYDHGNLQMMFFGKKAAEHFKRRQYPIFDINTEIFDALSFENVAPMAEHFMKLFSGKKFDRIDIVYNKFKNASVQEPTHEQFLPFQAPEKEESGLIPDYIFEPGIMDMVKQLIPKTLKIQLYKALLDSSASEHGARMTAMHKATDNAQELLKDLKLSYNKARQAAITNELIEIVSGANALNE
ncbi:MAG: ATP synthase F1 subunit gamma [Bacteroidales bacterium]